MMRYRSNLFFSAAFTLASLALSASALAAAPVTEGQIPVYPGAKPFKRDPSENSAPFLNGAKTSTRKVYRVDAPIEQVVGFYKSKLHATINGATGPGSESLSAGAVSEVEGRVHFLRLQDQDYGESHVVVSEKRQKEILSACRKPYEPGKWVSGAQFSWDSKSRDGAPSSYAITLTDEGIAPKWKSCVPRTVIEVAIDRGASESAIAEESDRAEQKALDARVKAASGKPPTAKDLGIPLYPGATYDARNSAGMSSGQKAWIFQSGDETAKVVKFYESKLGKKAQNFDGTYAIALKGSLPMPEESLVIQPNTMFGGSAKTVITVTKP